LAGLRLRLQNRLRLEPCRTVHFGAAPGRELHLEPLPTSTGEVEPQNVTPPGSVELLQVACHLCPESGTNGGRRWQAIGASLGRGRWLRDRSKRRRVERRGAEGARHGRRRSGPRQTRQRRARRWTKGGKEGIRGKEKGRGEKKRGNRKRKMKGG